LYTTNHSGIVHFICISHGPVLLDVLSSNGTERGRLYMVIVTKQKGESEDRLIARFKKLVTFSGILQEARDRAHYKTPSEKRKEQKYAIKHKIELEKKRNG
jgi:ribosomal protein S21